MPIANLPDELMTDEVFKAGFRGIFVGGCIVRKEGSSFRATAHMHMDPKYPYFGWICIRGKKRAAQKSLLIHELAHLISKEGHTRKFYETVRRLGGRITGNDRRIAPKSTKGL
jgi:hypothetical protein